MCDQVTDLFQNIKSLTLQKSARESHIKGAVALIKLRKPESFHNSPSLRLYLAVRGQIVSNESESHPSPGILTTHSWDNALKRVILRLFKNSWMRPQAPYQKTSFLLAQTDLL